MKTKHTPTPWIINPQHTGGIFASFGERIGECGQANAEFIVKAVNSHDALVEALKEAVRIFERFPITTEEAGLPWYKLAKQALVKAGE